MATELGITSSREHAVRALAHLSERDIERIVVDWLRKNCDDFAGMTPEECKAEWRENRPVDYQEAGSHILTIHGEKQIEDRP